MAKRLSQAQKDKISAKQRDSWKDPTKRIEQNKREAKMLLKDIDTDRIEALVLSISKAKREALIDEIKKQDDQGWQIILDVLINFFIRQRRPFLEILNILEKTILIKVLHHVNGNLSDAAKFLDLKYITLYQKVRRHNIKFLKTPIED